MNHGGDIRALARQVGRKPEEILDFSASINPFGPPHSVAIVLSQATDFIDQYPDPAATDFCQAIAARHKVSPEHVIAGNGSSELLLAIAREFSSRRFVLSEPCYTGYSRAARMSGTRIHTVPRRPSDFGIDWEHLDQACDALSVVVLDDPNNPTGRLLDREQLTAIVSKHPETIFVIDDSFSGFVCSQEKLLSLDAPNVILLRSMTKFYAIPGLRLGYAVASPQITANLSRQLPEWTVNAIAQVAGCHCLGDDDYASRTRQSVAEWRQQLMRELALLPGVHVYPGEANFLLCRLDSGGTDAKSLARKLLQNDGIAIRACGNFGQLDDHFFRIAVRTPEENNRLLHAVRRVLLPSGKHTTRMRRRTPALMLQGVSSNAGKSILTAAFCRILAREGVRVAPFKSQNMSLNSFVTRVGHEISRAQVVQSQACRLEPDVRMNPILLKPNSHTGSQVIIDGHPIGNMRVKEYLAYKPTAFEHAKDAYDSLAEEFDVMVLEGAGSPGEVNLKHADIVNMTMARHANASVLLVGDIDRGGVFASFVGTMSVLEPWERRLVSGYIVNRFRGDASLLDDAYRYMLEHTGKPVLGTVPNINELGIPDEDSVSFKQNITRSDGNTSELDVVVIDLPHISNLSDFDPLMSEPDAHVRTVRDSTELGTPNVVILPGSRNTIHDLEHLRARGFEPALKSLAAGGRTELVGICGGFQMLGNAISDPGGVESQVGRAEGFGLLDIETELATDKTLRQVEAVHEASGELVTGYEIHHGTTRIGDAPVMLASTGGPLAVSDATGRIWGTYLHGAFERDGFRRWFLDRLRHRKGLPPLGNNGSNYNLDAAYDRLADIVRDNMDMTTIYQLLGL
ncbi:MAG: threonine-phosphate decarboxylase [Planctomycetes bacterium]|nr:threonine-phosphate decarboxylase [Planctomycetota bacterium]